MDSAPTPTTTNVAKTSRGGVDQCSQDAELKNSELVFHSPATYAPLQKKNEEYNEVTSSSFFTSYFLNLNQMFSFCNMQHFSPLFLE